MKLVRRMLIMLVLAAIVFGGVLFFDGFRAKMIAKFMKNFADPSQSVATMQATVQPWQPEIQAVANLRAMNGADLSTDIDGIVDQIDFKSGDDVEKGAVLLRLRTEDDAAKLVQLRSAQALAQTNYDRDLRQLQAQAVSRAVVDTDRSALTSAQAAVAQQQALIAKKVVIAPFAGHLGIREVDVGQYVSAGTAIVTLQALDPIFADFYVPQQQIAQLHVGGAVRLRVDAYPDRDFTGTIESVNAKVDAATRTLQLRALFPNHDHALLPGMFGTVEARTGQPQGFITLPQTAIAYNPYGSTVFVVEQSGAGATATRTVRQVFVQTGQTRGDQVAVTGGLAAGQTVVVAGQTKLHNGTKVTINNSILPADDPDPHPVEQ